MASSDRKPYETATVLDQAFLNECADNLVNQLELVVDIKTPAETIYASDRNKYVSGIFYEALCKFPIIKRGVGEFLSPELSFDTVEIEVSNVDGRFNNVLPSGADYDGFIGRFILVRLGLRDVAGTYTVIFQGPITEESGVSRETKSIKFVARNRFDSVNKTFPATVFKTSVYPFLEPGLNNTIVPIIYGDWTINLADNVAMVPAYIVNSADPDMNGDTSHTNNVKLVISENALSFFDNTKVTLVRSDLTVLFDSSDITNISLDNNYFEIIQNGTTLIDGSPFEYESGDNIFVQVRGKNVSSGPPYNDNIVAQARDILETFGGLGAADFDANWVTYRDKATPAISAISTFKSRVWVREQQSCLQYALSMLEQCRLEAYLDRNERFKISSLHLEDWNVPASITHTINNFDIERGSFKPSLDSRMNFNRAQGVFNFSPRLGESIGSTAIHRNQAAINQAGKEISKQIVFPNLIDETVVTDQTIELLRIASGYIENINTNLTWRSLLLDIGDFVNLTVNIDGIEVNAPALIREIGYDPDGIKIPVRLWSMQMLPYSTWSPGYSGIVGGATATITAE